MLSIVVGQVEAEGEGAAEEETLELASDELATRLEDSTVEAGGDAIGDADADLVTNRL
jgi:hypothetical protein